ncbi:undecaprenyl-diphosphate phosphatase [Lipingzhangella sp. LS1_29]|uniref:Undecaprenyl-diphosphatase n=1 Tax=Lipingzhangella rawalii TaxID=2055835 RepID=A0ABU2HA70_9ACTN|nr:undecaprenyl-diphosphate phosphatase [Lipingzhangella rawalii]MDS1272176.1 undecaprenyl-diphosphate phosphatase [Lipingzhangella rawalii]
MSLLEAILLGVVQGLFMFVPVSSTSHLVLAQHWLQDQGSAIANPESADMMLFDLVVHVGTLVSIAVVFRNDLWRLLTRTVADLRSRCGGGPPTEGLYLRLFLLGMLSTAITGVLALPVRELVAEDVFATALALVFMWTATGAVLWWTDILGPRRRGLRDLTPWIAVGIGLVQAAALVPGLSRSGITIVVALLLGLRRRWAAEYSFFIAIPTILGLTLGQFVLEADELSAVDPLPLLVAFVVAAVVGTFALLLVLRLLYRARMRYFAYYLWGLAAIVSVWQLGPIPGGSLALGLGLVTALILVLVTRYQRHRPVRPGSQRRPRSIEDRGS